ncbi:MAG: hypothetical protein ACREIG_00960, partial [Nitrospiraceae bacterium]
MLFSGKQQGRTTLVLLLALFLTYGCVPRPIKFENEDLVRIKEEKEILAVHYPGTSPSTTYDTNVPGAPGGGVILL